ncbi:MAG: hypothetical protein EGS50_12395 [Alistipes senegalensis]|nr:hypothetical protein [Alistipes senegalensis]
MTETSPLFFSAPSGANIRRNFLRVSPCRTTVSGPGAAAAAIPRTEPPAARFWCCQFFFVSLAAPKILPLGKMQVNLLLPSLIRIFVRLLRNHQTIRPECSRHTCGCWASPGRSRNTRSPTFSTPCSTRCSTR